MELMKQERPAELVREEPGYMPVILQMASMPNVDADKLMKLMELQERWDASQARKAYVQAMADFKNEAIVITRDKDNKQYGSKYTSIGNLMGTVTPLLSKHGLSANHQLDQSAGIRVGCTITHAFGHSETTWITVPLDTSGAKNPIQQIKSSITYGRIITFESACGLASREGNLDDDGNGAGGGSMELEEFDRYFTMIETVKNLTNLQTIFKQAYLAAEKAKDETAKSQFIAAKDKRKEELNEGR